MIDQWVHVISLISSSYSCVPEIEYYGFVDCPIKCVIARGIPLGDYSFRKALRDSALLPSLKSRDAFFRIGVIFIMITPFLLSPYNTLLLYTISSGY